MTQGTTKATVRTGNADGHLGRRFAAHYRAQPDKVKPLAADNPSVLAGRSIFHRQVVPAAASPALLMSGGHQRKIGNRVTKGRWRGMPIYTLTLEERATCPSSCAHWLTCYGNSMPFARRHEHGPALEVRLVEELAATALRHPSGFVLRLHVLGDFYDAAYTALWHRWMCRFTGLHLFGYTANEPASDVGLMVRLLNQDFAGRCLIRFSGEADGHVPAARTIWREPEAPRVPEGIVCPAQTGRTACCGTCGLCWATTEPIVFIGHGRRSGDAAGRLVRLASAAPGPRPAPPASTARALPPAPPIDRQAPLFATDAPNERVRLAWIDIVQWSSRNKVELGGASQRQAIEIINEARSRFMLPIFEIDDRLRPMGLLPARVSA